MGISFQLVQYFNRNFRTLSRGLVHGNIGRKTASCGRQAYAPRSNSVNHIVCCAASQSEL